MLYIEYYILMTDILNFNELRGIFAEIAHKESFSGKINLYFFLRVNL
jgi:hypothetical protein